MLAQRHMMRICLIFAIRHFNTLRARRDAAAARYAIFRHAAAMLWRAACFARARCHATRAICRCRAMPAARYITFDIMVGALKMLQICYVIVAIAFMLI